MPTYAYKCTECGNAFDIQQAFSDDSLTACPSCGGALRKVFGAVGITFNGSGFYRTDSRAAAKDSSPATPKKEPATASSTAAGSNTSGDSGGGSPGKSSSATATTTPKTAQNST